MEKTLLWVRQWSGSYSVVARPTCVKEAFTEDLELEDSEWVQNGRCRRWFKGRCADVTTWQTSPLDAS